MYVIYGIIAVLLLWTIYGFASSRVEQTNYTVLENKNGYEIRLYPEHIVAQTTVKGTYRDSMNEGFRIVAGYIFGGNSSKTRIAMTAPVVDNPKGNEKIAMTAPVLANLEGDTHTIAFGMPRAYTLETLPVPTDPRVQLVTIPEMKIAARRFSWFRTDRAIQSQKESLLSLLARDGLEVKGEIQYAGYNAPGTPPWMTRNEVLVQI